MKTEITVFKISDLNNETHVEFHEVINQMITDATADKLGLQNFYPLYGGALNNEKEALDYITKSSKTKLIKMQDGVRNSIFRGFSDVIMGLTNHYTAEVRADASIIWNIFTHYGSMTKRKLDARTSAIKDLLDELNTPVNKEIMKRIEMLDWVSALGLENVKMRALMRARYDEKNTKTKYRMATCRKETDKFLRAMIADIENRKLVGTATPELDDFITAINVVLSRFKNILAQGKGRSGSEKSGELKIEEKTANEE
jgi:hypothetical protein